jgi:hypothetical protein
MKCSTTWMMTSGSACVEAKRAKDWVLGLRCVLHSASSAIKWGLGPFIFEQLLDDLHLSIKSCNNTSQALHGCVSLFVLRHLGYRDAPQSRQERSVWWTCLGVPTPLIDWVLRVDPRWDPVSQLLRVSSELDGLLDGVQLVENVLTYFLRWRNFSDTRWAGVGPSARHLICSLAVGLEPLIKLVDANGKGNDRYYLSAAKTRMLPAVKKLAAIGALSSYPIESMSLELLEDDRWLLKAESLWSEAEVEAEWVANLPDFVFDSLSLVVGDPTWTGA